MIENTRGTFQYSNSFPVPSRAGKRMFMVSFEDRIYVYRVPLLRTVAYGVYSISLQTPLLLLDDILVGRASL